ncbi:hypothetical protein [Jiella mangrovi]|uniref:hypothetical protein n=1 Tax=Jiella mangrovi TaxID=2821407 RepID=UPI001AEAC9C5|nr:hypothetical protein [Jiella mangrovi]
MKVGAVNRGAYRYAKRLPNNDALDDRCGEKPDDFLPSDGAVADGHRERIGRARKAYSGERHERPIASIFRSAKTGWREARSDLVTLFRG